MGLPIVILFYKASQRASTSVGERKPSPADVDYVYK